MYKEKILQAVPLPTNALRVVSLCQEEHEPGEFLEGVMLTEMLRLKNLCNGYRRAAQDLPESKACPGNNERREDCPTRGGDGKREARALRMLVGDCLSRPSGSAAPL
jgi:hypothetical protein